MDRRRASGGGAHAPLGLAVGAGRPGQGTPSALRPPPISRAATGTPHGPGRISRGTSRTTSVTLRRAGSILADEDRSPAHTPPAAVSASPQPSVDDEEAGDGLGVAQTVDEPVCGLTPASLKHLRRQNMKLTEQTSKLSAEVADLQEKLREQKQRTAILEEEHGGCPAREEELRASLVAANERAEAEKIRADELQKQADRLEELLAAREAEIDRLRQALEDQRQVTKEVCEAAENQKPDSSQDAALAKQISDLEERIRVLTRENSLLEQARKVDIVKHAHSLEESQKAAAAAMCAAEKMLEAHKANMLRVEALKSSKLADAIQHKVELHIAVPRVTLTYNNAPPLYVSVATGLNEARIREFLDSKVFPFFDPLWITLDGSDLAPDGSSKKVYSTKMLERLTEAVKGFIERSQSDSEGGAVLGAGMPSGSIAGTIAAPPKAGSKSKAPVTAKAAAAQAEELSDANREALLRLLQSGDDRGLDSKMSDILRKAPK